MTSMLTHIGFVFCMMMILKYETVDLTKVVHRNCLIMRHHFIIKYNLKDISFSSLISVSEF